MSAWIPHLEFDPAKIDEPNCLQMKDVRDCYVPQLQPTSMPLSATPPVGL